MDHTELTNMILIAANKIIIVIKGEDYDDDPVDEAIHLVQGIEIIFFAYDGALMQQQSTTNLFGNA